MIDHNRKLLFIHIARTGGTSIETALVGKDWWKVEKHSKHMSATQARQYYGEDIWSQYTKFTVIRNPWDRIISMWATKWWHPSSCKEDSLLLWDFILQLRCHPSELYKSIHYHQILNANLDFILRFETLQVDFSTMLSQLNFDGIPLPHQEKRERKHYREIFNEDSKELVRSIFRKDIASYGYEY